MIHIDEAVSMLESNFPNCNCEASAEKVWAEIISGNLKVTITFVEKAQVFNFDNGKGKNYSFTSIEALKSNVDTFFYMENDFKPKSQAICSVFNSQVLNNAGVVIKGIRGGNNQNFTAIYSVSGTNDEVIVAVEDIDSNIFSITYNDKVYRYSMDEVGNIYLIPTVDNYSDELHKRYADSTFVQVARTGSNTFSFKYENGLVIDICAIVLVAEPYKLEISVDKVEYNGRELVTDYGIINLENICDLAELYTNFDYLIEEGVDCVQELDRIASETIDDISDDFEDESSTSDDIEEDSDTFDEIDEFDEVEEVDEEVEDVEEVEDIEEVEDVEEVEPVIEKADFTTLEEKAEAVEDDFKLVLIQDIDGVLTKVRFAFPDKYLDMNVDIAIELGIPIGAIILKEKQLIKRGMLITDMELKHRIFAKDISKDKTLCSSVVSKLFS